jgi:hypothetical protein
VITCVRQTTRAMCGKNRQRCFENIPAGTPLDFCELIGGLHCYY